MLEFRRSLPAFKAKEALLKTISENQVNKGKRVLFVSVIYNFFYSLKCSSTKRDKEKG